MLIQKLKNVYHLFEAIIANLFYGYPSKKLKVIGVTGTDGKTTTTHLIYHILKKAGKKVSMISSVYAIIGNQEFDTGFHVTTPSSFMIQKFLQEAVKKNQQYFILETTSHALDQNRVFGINYNIGVLTNITHEHLDYHQSYDNYLKTKMKLLNRSQSAIINKDDQSFKKNYSLINKQTVKIYTYGLKNNSDFNINFQKSIHNLADFNRYNYLAAYSVCKILNIEDDIINQAIKSFVLPPGRLKILQDKGITTVIDFAHTPNAITNVLDTVKKQFLLSDKGRLIHVFGSAGLRDTTKRPFMGQASGRFADLVILTEEDYRTENPRKICQQIAQGLKKTGLKYFDSNQFNDIDRGYCIILDRQKAFDKAIHIAKKGDVVIFTGKGHEKSLCRKQVEYPWDENEAVLNSLNKKV